MRALLVTLLLLAAALPAQQFKPDRRFPAVLRLSSDWYAIADGAEPYRLRTNHSLATLSVRFSGTDHFGLDWDISRIGFATLAPGTFAWRLSKGSRPGAWVLVEPVRDHQILVSGLDTAIDYTFEMIVTSPPIPASSVPIAVSSTIERCRDTEGLQGSFVDLVGFVTAPSVSWLARPTPAAAPLRVLILGDSLADGLVPFNAAGAPHPFGALLSWPARAAALAASLRPTPQEAHIVNHAFRGWWGCELEFPFMGFVDEASFRAAQPWSIPRLGDQMSRSHPGAPEFADSGFELVIYQLAQNDLLTGRLANPAAYRQDIIDNVNLIRARYPAAKVLVCATHLSSPSGLTQRSEMLQALLTAGYRTDPMLHFVDTGAILDAFGLSGQPGHPLQFIHDIWTFFIGLEIAAFL